MNKDILNHLRRDEAIDEEVLEALLTMQGSQKLDTQSIVKKIYREEKPNAISKKEMHILSDTIRYGNKKSILNDKDWFDIFTDTLSYLIFFLVFGVFLWMTWHSQSRASIDYGFEPMSVLIISGIIILFIALLEGSQIAIINISDKDISNVSENYPITYEIQKLTRTKEAIQDYLIGRQLLVVALVIVFSLLTSFPNIPEYYKEIQLPGLVDLIAFKLGLLNALILLWLGQLIPQLLATKAPQSILNIRLVKYVVYLCLYLSRLKIAKPSSLVVDLADIIEHEPPMSEYESFTKNLDMYRHYLDSYTVVIRYDHESNIITESNRKFIFLGNVNRIIRRTLGIYGAIDNYKLSEIKATRKNGDEFNLVDTGSTAEPIVNEDMIFFSHILEPQTSIFHEGDILEMEDHFELSKVEQLDIRIDRPVRVLFIKCCIPVSTLDIQNVKIPDLNVSIAVFDEPTEEYHIDKTIRISPEKRDGLLVASYAALFPTLKSSISINWEVK